MPVGLEGRGLGARPKQMRMWDKVREDVLEGLMSRVGVPEATSAPLQDAAWVRLTLWADWLKFGLSGGEENLEDVVILPATFTEAFVEGYDAIEKIEAGEFEGTEVEREDEEVKQATRVRYLRESWDKAAVLVAILSVERESNFAIWVERKFPAEVRVYEGGSRRNDALQKQLVAMRIYYVFMYFFEIC